MQPTSLQTPTLMARARFLKEIKPCESRTGQEGRRIPYNRPSRKQQTGSRENKLNKTLEAEKQIIGSALADLRKTTSEPGRKNCEHG